MNHLKDLVTNPFFVTGISSWMLAQVLKCIIHSIVHKKFEISRLFGDGGMPSGHSATVSSVACIAAFHCGLNSFEFALSALLAIIVCHDAMGVRLETGKQSMVINEIIETFNKIAQEKVAEVKLKEFVGHTPLQVGAGITLGIVNACVIHFCILHRFIA